MTDLDSSMRKEDTGQQSMSHGPDYDAHAIIESDESRGKIVLLTGM